MSAGEAIKEVENSRDGPLCGGGVGRPHVPIEMPRTQNPRAGARFPQEHYGQKLRQFGKS